ncbi:CRISPR-associated protein Csx19 [Armatimonas sp.]|uniref:type III-D CRISPR-associated protein Csx19 n=1 Tax=Armatimonas sp. TaxID=1872638 RepID=UPI003750D945
MNAAAYLDWLLGGPKPEGASDSLVWAVLQATDTLVWAIREGDTWQRADQVPNSEVRDYGVRVPHAERVFEARLFGPEVQLLLWRNEEGELNHATLKADEGDLKRTLLFTHEVDRREAKENNRSWTPPEPCSARFLWYSDRAGRVTVVPKGYGLEIAQHLEEDPETGLVRIVATRFVKIVNDKEPSHA